MSDEQNFYDTAHSNIIVNQEEQERIEWNNRTRDMFTALPVEVTAVHGGGVSIIGTVDAKPLVKIMCADGQTAEYPELYNLPFMRYQGGANAVICDPQVGDIGIAVFASRDISAVKRARGHAPCGSLRRFSLSDGMYVGAILDGIPSQYIHFDTAGITILSPKKITLEAPEILIDSPIIRVTGNFEQTGTKGQHSTFSGNIVTTGGDIKADTVSLKEHIHKDAGGSGNSGKPVQ